MAAAEILIIWRNIEKQYAYLCKTYFFVHFKIIIQ